MCVGRVFDSICVSAGFPGDEQDLGLGENDPGRRAVRAHRLYALPLSGETLRVRREKEREREMEIWVQPPDHPWQHLP